jgi:outer membrane lipoprotein-sorting protein
MPFRRAVLTISLVLSFAFGVPGCLVRRRVVARQGANPRQQLLVADTATLLGVVQREYNAIQNFSATVDMTPVLGSAEKNHLTEYKEVRGYILFRKPDQIRIIGLFPVVRNKAFDMVSIGPNFELYLPSRNRFIVGKNSIEAPSQNKIENLRPQHFLDALLVRPPDLATTKVVIENFTDEDDAFYILYSIHELPGGRLQLARSIWFSRVDLTIARQLIFDPQGNILTDARYSKWHAYDNVPFPQHIDIDRPRDEYGVVMSIVKMDINKGVSEDKFVLERPPGTTLQEIGQAPPAPAADRSAPPSKGNPRKK